MPPGKGVEKRGSREKGKVSQVRPEADPLVRAPDGRVAWLTAFPTRQMLVWDRDGTPGAAAQRPQRARGEGCGVVVRAGSYLHSGSGRRASSGNSRSARGGWVRPRTGAAVPRLQPREGKPRPPRPQPPRA